MYKYTLVTGYTLGNDHLTYMWKRDIFFLKNKFLFTNFVEKKLIYLKDAKNKSFDPVVFNEKFW
jgi:hypothetical protein